MALGGRKRGTGRAGGRCVVEGARLRTALFGGTGSSALPGGPGSLRAPLAAGGLRINLNRADRADLMRLPGITSAMATRILKHRERHGRFDRVDELQQVPGIDPETYTKLQPHIYVA